MAPLCNTSKLTKDKEKLQVVLSCISCNRMENSNPKKLTKSDKRLDTAKMLAPRFKFGDNIDAMKWKSTGNNFTSRTEIDDL